MSSSDEPATENQVNFVSLIIFIVAMVGWAVFAFGLGQNTATSLLSALFLSIGISVIIAEACDPFAEAAQWIGERFRLPGSVRGATLDAVASSMPELFTGVFFVVVALWGENNDADRLTASANGYGSTIATCAGSSIYNMILIPAVCAIAISYSRLSQPIIKIEKAVIYRDAVWAMGAQFALLVCLFMPKLHWEMALFAMIAYAIYVIQLYRDAMKFREDQNLENDVPEDSRANFLFGRFSVQLNLKTSIIVLVLATLTAAFACYFLVELTNETATHLNIPPFFVAVILTAAVSSVPDTLMSLGAAKRGDDSGAISNAFGSNIFDICIGMSIPLLVFCYLNNWQPVSLVGENQETMKGVTGLRILLFVLTSVTMFVIARKRQVTRGNGYFLVGLYVIFVVYAVLGSLGILTL